MNGTMFVYHPERRLVAFQTGEFERALVFIGGLTDGFLSLGYLGKLSSTLNEDKISLIQVVLSSSYGTCSLAKDAEELTVLVKYLKEKRNIIQVSLLGHSTGCQDIIKLLKDYEDSHQIYKAILQGPVSDREYMNTFTTTAKYLEKAKEMIADGKSEELMPRDAYDVPITAYRYNSLAGYLGDDDFFSSDLRQHERESIFKHISVSTLWVFSEADQYVPPHVSIPTLAQFIHKAVPDSELLLLKDEKHEIATQVDTFVDAVTKFLTR